MDLDSLFFEMFANGRRDISIKKGIMTRGLYLIIFADLLSSLDTYVAKTP